MVSLERLTYGVVVEVSSQQTIWQVLDRVHAESSLTGSELGASLAALIYLRWADFQEAEQEAIAAFEDTEYQPVLPARWHWRSYCDWAPERLQSLFAQDLPEVLERLAVRQAFQPDREAGRPEHVPAEGGVAKGEPGKGGGGGAVKSQPGKADVRIGSGQGNARATYLQRIAPAVARLGKLPASVLGQLTAWLAVQPFETQNDRRRLSETLDEVLQRTRDRYAGQYYTTPTVARLLVELGAPSAGDRVYDPCFGSARLLTAAADYVRQHASDRVARSGEPLLTIAGVELDRDMYTIGLTRLALAGITDPQLELGNSLERAPWNNPQRDGFDLFLADPPWGLKVDLDGLDHFPLRSHDSTSLFIQHALAQLRPEGRAAIVVPVSVLSGSGRLKLRQMLLEQHTVEAVVGLAPEMFLPAKGVEAAILLVRRGGSTKSIRMVNAAEGTDARSKKPGTVSDGDRSVEIAAAVTASAPTGRGWEVRVEQLVDMEWDLTPKRRDRSGLDRLLGSLPAPVSVISLGDCVEMTSGRAVRTRDLRQDPPWEVTIPLAGASGVATHPDLSNDVEWIPYIRIKDVQTSDISRGSAWVTADASQTAEARWRLRSGDILLSKSGTIGKSGMVRNGAVGGVAAAGFFVLRLSGDTLDPHYLLAFLQSAECRAWLDDRARGYTTRQLSMRSLKDLPVPVPPLPIQQRAVEQHRQFGVDILSYLAELLSEAQGEPVAVAINAWVDANLLALERGVSADGIEADLDLLERVAEIRCPVNMCASCGKPYCLDVESPYLSRPEDYALGIDTTCLACWLGAGTSSETVQSLSAKSPLAAWALSFREATQPLSRISNIPEATGLLNVVQSVRARLDSALDRIQGGLPNEEKARRLTHRLRVLAERTANRLLGDIKIAVNVIHATVRENGETDIALRITNESRLPLREMSFTTNPKLAYESANLPYQLPGESDAIQFIGTLPDNAGPVSLELHWTGRNLNGERFFGSREIRIHASSQHLRGADVAGDLGPSPYITGNPVKADRGDVFFGREELLGQIRRQIGRSGNVVLLEGNRRAGKSSILWHLEGPQAVPGWLGVYCSFQGTEGDNAQTSRGVPTVEVFRGIAVEIAKSLQKHLGSVLLPDRTVLAKGKPGIADAVRPAIKDEAPFTYFREYLELLLDALAESKLGLLLLLDEFDKLQEGIDRGVTSPQVPENIRFLLQSCTGLSAVLTGTKRMKRIREEYFSVLYGLGTAFDVSALPRDAASRLVVEPVQGQLVYASEAVERAVVLTAGQPYLLQCLCDGIFRMAKELGFRSITLDHVNTGAEALVRDNGHFVDLFRYAGSDRRRLILAVCHRESQGPDPLRSGVIHEKLLGLGVDVREEQLAADLDWLTDFELLRFSGAAGGDTYALAVPLMGDWIDTRDYAGLLSKARAETEDDDDE